MKIYLRFLAIPFLLLPAICKADWYYDFVRITCIPEARYLQFEAKSIEGSYVLMETQFDDKLKKQRLAAWVKKGYYDPARLEFECRLPEATYKITTSQSAYESSPIILSLYKDGSPIIDNVTLGGNSSGRTSVQSVEISDGLQGWDSRQMTICWGFDSNQSCKFLSETYGDISKAIPINQDKLDAFASPKKQ